LPGIHFFCKKIVTAFQNSIVLCSISTDYKVTAFYRLFGFHDYFFTFSGLASSAAAFYFAKSPAFHLYFPPRVLLYIVLQQQTPHSGSNATGASARRKADIMEEAIREKLEELRGMLQADGGDLEVVSITGKTVLLRLRGACGACPHAQMTLKDGIERILRESVDPEIVVERA
jgi:Fe-S cluster biogenesis protein NfuA